MGNLHFAARDGETAGAATVASAASFWGWVEGWGNCWRQSEGETWGRAMFVGTFPENEPLRMLLFFI
jgi:hypothetical protein